MVPKSRANCDAAQWEVRDWPRRKSAVGGGPHVIPESSRFHTGPFLSAVARGADTVRSFRRSQRRSILCHGS